MGLGKMETLQKKEKDLIQLKMETIAEREIIVLELFSQEMGGIALGA